MIRTRDELAEEILLAMLKADPEINPNRWDVNLFASNVYAMADAMIAHRRPDTRTFNDTGDKHWDTGDKHWKPGEVTCSGSG